MITNNTNQLWGYFNGRGMYYFRSYRELVVYLASFNNKFGTEVVNHAIEYIGTNDNDVLIYRRPKYSIEHIEYIEEVHLRDHRIYTPDGKVIWNNQIKKDILLCNYDKSEYDSWWKWWRDTNPSKIRSKWARWSNVTYPEFRNGPWPRIRKSRGGSWYRQISVMNEKRQAADPDMRVYFRGDRGMNLPDPYDTEPIRDYSNRGWKKQGKRRKQWMADNRKNKGVYVVKKPQKTVEFDIEKFRKELIKPADMESAA